MKIDNIAFLIPVHPPHYHYIYNLINKCKNNDIEVDIFLVFSNFNFHNNHRTNIQTYLFFLDLY